MPKALLCSQRSLVLVALALLQACNDGGVTVVPNTAPQVRLEAPVSESPDEPVLIESGGALSFVAVVNDAEDAEPELLVRWVANRIDAVVDPVVLGEDAPDVTGYVERIIGGLDAGLYRIAARVIDTDGASAEASQSVRFRDVNVAPGVTITQPLPGSNFTAGSVITFTGTVSDDGGPGNLDIEWYSNIDGLLDIAAPTSSGLLTFSRPNLTVGSHTVTLTVTDADGAEATAQVMFAVTPADNPPFDPVIRIEPQNPTTDDDLRCAIVQGSADPEGNPITYVYRWYRDSVQTLITGDTVLSTQTERLQEWTCEVVASDGVLYSNTVSDSVVVGNTPPTMTGVSLAPSPAYEDSVLTCAGAGFQDDDGDPEGYVAAWFVSGAPLPGVTGTTLDGAWFDRGDTVTCQLAPWDGAQQGASIVSNAVTILNTAPSVPTISVDPEPEARVDDAIACLVDVESVDLDGDPLLNPDSYEVQWAVDGTVDAASAGLWIVPPTRTRLGQEWTCRVRATDGVDWSAWAEASTTVLPRVGDLVITEFLADSVHVPDVAGEWVELYNAAPYAVDLNGFELADDGIDSHTIATNLTVPPGARVVLTRNADYGTNGGVVAAYEYGNFTLDNSTDEIVVRYRGREIDRFNYDLGAFPNITGHSLSYDESQGPPTWTSNNSAGAWCPSGNPFAGPLSDFGSPGGAHDGCTCFASDSDGDGYGDDATCSFQDCDDNNPAWNPEADDICENGLDENCDGGDAFCVCTETDSDGDGFGDGALCLPPDCNDNNPTIYPGAQEVCDAIDQNCDSILNNGVASVMCPLTAEVASTECHVSNVCAVLTCSPDYYDVNRVYNDGCECADDSFGGPTCQTAYDVGPIQAGQTATITGRLPDPSSVDWLLVTFPINGRPGSGNVQVQLTARPDPSYTLEVRQSCGAGPTGCGSGGNANGVTHYQFLDNQSYGQTAWSSNGTSWPNALYIKVKRSGGVPSCATYTVTISR